VLSLSVEGIDRPEDEQRVLRGVTFNIKPRREDN